MGISVNLARLLDDEKCFAFVREMRWPCGVSCPKCASLEVVRNGHDDTQPFRQRYLCSGCGSRFDDLTGTILAGRHQSLKVWVLCLYLMGLNLSNRQIAGELELAEGDVQAMTGQLRAGLMDRAEAPLLEGEVEIDEVYVIAGHKGHPAAVQKKAAKDGATG
jgi:transposase-like protein